MQTALDLAYRPHPDQAAVKPAHHPVIVAGAGPVGLALAIDLAQAAIPVVLLDADETLAAGSRAICFAKRTLEIFDRLGCGEAVRQAGIGWHVGRVFFRQHEVFQFDLLAEPGHANPAFVNLPQYTVEAHLLARARELPYLDLRFGQRVSAVGPGDTVRLTADTPDGPYALTCDWLIAADGSRSPIRAMLGAETQGRSFRDRFLIADIKLEAGFPAERRFWFDPPFNPGHSVLLHRQPGDIWRIDFQLGWDADPVAEREPARIRARIEAMLGAGVEFEIVWASVYTFGCARMARFRHGRVLFAGDAAHTVSPFGARGANSGVQDADNLAWKLAHVLRGEAPETLLDSYCAEREAAADENILHSTRATDFITPKSVVSRQFRDAVLSLAKDAPFARALINSGRLSQPSHYAASPLNTKDIGGFLGGVPPGAACVDAPLAGGGWLLPLTGGQFTLLYFAGGPAPPEVAAADIPVSIRVLSLAGADLLAARYDAFPGTVYLVRPDQHVAARFRRFDKAAIAAALARATGREIADA